MNDKFNAMEITSHDYYFDRMSHYAEHEDIMRDHTRTNTYLNIILKNKESIKDKVVLEIGCGTGLFSMLLAKMGAKKVIAVDSSNIIANAKAIIADNKFTDIITCIKGVVGKDLVILPDNLPSVDIILCEWYGHTLYQDNRIAQVIYAREHWGQNAIILPNQVDLYMLAVEDQEYKYEKFDYWDNVYGFDMSPIKRLSQQEPLIDSISTKQILSDEICIQSINIYTITLRDLHFNAKFKLNFNKKDFFFAYLLYFNVHFNHDTLSYSSSYSTGPYQEETTWKQTLFFLKEQIPIDIGDSVEGFIEFIPHDKQKEKTNYTTTAPPQLSIQFTQVKIKDKQSIENSIYHLA